MLSHHIPCEVREHPGTIQPDFSAWKAPQEVLEQVAAQSNFFGTSNTHAQSHQKGCSSYSTWPNTMDTEFYAFLGVWDPIKVAWTPQKVALLFIFAQTEDPSHT